MKPAGQRANLADIQLALAAEDLRHHALGTDLEQVAVVQVVLFHKEAQHLSAAGDRHGVMLLLVVLRYPPSI